jgi:hypothetical protein
MHTRELRWASEVMALAMPQHVASTAASINRCRSCRSPWALDSLCVAPAPTCTYSNTRRKGEIKETLRCCRSVFQLSGAAQRSRRRGGNKKKSRHHQAEGGGVKGHVSTNPGRISHLWTEMPIAGALFLMLS